VTERVLQQVREYLSDPDRVDVQDGKSGRNADLESNVLRVGTGAERIDCLLHQALGFHGLTVEAERSRLRGRERQQIVQKPGHNLGLLEHALEAGLVRGVHAVEHPLRVPPDHGERRAEFMGDVGQEVPPVLLAFSQSFHHLVERSGQPADVAGPALLHPNAVIAAGHALGRLHHVAHGLRHPPHRAAGRHERHEQADREDGDEGREASGPVEAEAA
jgi:hypothetical protein